MRFRHLHLGTLLVLLLLSTPSMPVWAADDAPFPTASPESQGMDSAALGKLADVVRNWVEKEQAIGAELLVIKNRRTVFHEGFGWRDREDEVPMGTDTIFNIRSMTKTLTGAAVQILIDEGKLKLTDTVAQYLPSFGTEKAKTITLQQLLEHRSGLPLSIMKLSTRDHPSLLAMADAAGEHGPDFEPGSKFWYSDAGSDTLGAVIEKASGQTLEAFMTQRLLEPLGMSDSFFPSEEEDPRWDRIASLYFKPRGEWGRIWRAGGRPFYPFAWGSQSLYSTPSDYARFLAMWMDGGRVGEVQLLSKASIERTLTPASKMTSLGSDKPFPTGFSGLEVTYGQLAVLHVPEGTGTEGQPLIFGHSGSDGTIAWAWPDHDLIALYFTQSRGALTPIRIESDIERLLIHPGVEETVPDSLRPYLGRYAPETGSLEVKVFGRGGRLSIDIPGELVYQLLDPDADGRWKFKGMEAASASFQRDEDGSVTGLTLHQPGRDFELSKKDTQVPAKVGGSVKDG